jgi:hypothetical protein
LIGTRTLPINLLPARPDWASGCSKLSTSKSYICSLRSTLCSFASPYPEYMALALRQRYRIITCFSSIPSAGPRLPRRHLSVTSRLRDKQKDVETTSNQAPPYPPDHRPTSQTTSTTKPPYKRQKSPLRIWPFLLILAGGTLMFRSLVKSREGQVPAKAGPSTRPF